MGFGVGSSFRVYSGARDGTVCVYDASDGMLLLKISLPFDVKSTTLESIAVSSSESCLYLASSDGNVYIVDMLAESEVGDSVYHSSKKVESRLIGSPQSPLTSIVLSLDEKFVLTGALDGTLSLWSTSHDRKLVRRWKTPDQEAICSLTMVCRSALISSASLEVSQPQRVLNGPLNSRLISSKTNRVSNASGEHVSAMPSSIETNLLINDGERVESMKRGYSFLLDFLFAAHRPV